MANKTSPDESTVQNYQVGNEATAWKRWRSLLVHNVGLERRDDAFRKRPKSLYRQKSQLRSNMVH